MPPSPPAGRIVAVLAYVPVAGREGGDNRARGANKASGGQGHWLVDTLIATPTSGHPEHKAHRTLWGVETGWKRVNARPGREYGK